MTCKLAGARDCQDALARLKIEQPLVVTDDPECPGGLRLSTMQGERVGRLTGRHIAAMHVAGGEAVLHCSVNSVSTSEPRHITIRIATGAVGDRYEAPPALVARSYLASLVGESHHQNVIARCAAGDAVLVMHEADNSYDKRALIVYAAAGQLGYLPRDSWLHRAVFEEGKGVAATIHATGAGERGLLGVQLEVEVVDGPILSANGAVIAAQSARQRAIANPISAAVPEERSLPSVAKPVVERARPAFWKRLFGR